MKRCFLALATVCGLASVVVANETKREPKRLSRPLGLADVAAGFEGTPPQEQPRRPQRTGRRGRRGLGRGQIAPDDDTGFTRIFDGKTLERWDGDSRFWRAENGEIVGESTPDNRVEQNSLFWWVICNDGTILDGKFVLFRAMSSYVLDAKCNKKYRTSLTCLELQSSGSCKASSYPTLH